jgi:hypothetical protein
VTTIENPECAAVDSLGHQGCSNYEGRSGNGGAISITRGSLTVSDTTMDRNQAGADTNGDYHSNSELAGGRGGAVFSDQCKLDIRTSAFTKNTGAHGSELDVQDAPTELVSSRFDTLGETQPIRFSGVASIAVLDTEFVWSGLLGDFGRSYYCPVGTTVVDDPRGSRCAACRPGSYVDRGANLTRALTDPSWDWAADPTLFQSCGKCQSCPAGRYGIAGAASTLEAGCQRCPAGYWQDQADGQSISCSPCAAGRYGQYAGESDAACTAECPPR